MWPTPELTWGLHYAAGGNLRRNVTEGKKGLPLLLKLTVLNVSTCKPIRNAIVEIWHCDAKGVYSGAFANNPSTNFLRGAQRTNASGVATFQTIYPGWYPDRAVHIHVKVHVCGAIVHTGQLFFPAAITAAVYKTTPYKGHGARPDPRTPALDLSQWRRQGMLKLTRDGAAGYVGAVATGVHR